MVAIMLMQASMKVYTKTSGKISREEETSTNMGRISIRGTIKATTMSTREATTITTRRVKAEERSDTTTEEVTKIEDLMRITVIKISSSHFLIETRRATTKILPL
jgi:hypothetical protein